MRNFLKLGDVVVGHIQQALWQNPDLWNKHRFRREFQGSPHGDVDDIWLRFGEDLALDQIENQQNDTAPRWWEDAEVLGPVVKNEVLNLMRAANGYQLDRLLITRLRPGGVILPHADNVGAYVAQKGIVRYHVVIQGLPGSMFYCGEEEVCMRTGEIWWFNSSLVHQVINNSIADRIHMLVDVRVWQ